MSNEARDESAELMTRDVGPATFAESLTKVAADEVECLRSALMLVKDHSELEDEVLDIVDAALATPSPQKNKAHSKPPANVYDALYDCLKQLGYVGSLEVIESGRMTASWIGKPGEGRDVEIKVSISHLPKNVPTQSDELPIKVKQYIRVQPN